MQRLLVDPRMRELVRDLHTGTRFELDEFGELNITRRDVRERCKRGATV